MANVTRSQVNGGAAAAQAASLAKDAGVPRTAPEAPEKSKATGYGLPCSKCRLYYPANLDACPTCKHTERLSPVTPKKPAKPVQTAPQPAPNSTRLEQEREEFLRQFKSQLLEAHGEGTKAPESACKLGEHRGEPDVAEICRSCYERLQERADVCQAALRMDLKEAAQIVYDAVWADPSNPGKTYENAASALLTELCKRAGITTALGPSQPLEH